MAGEIALDTGTGLTIYSQIRNRTSGYIWNGSAFEAYNAASGNQASYVNLMTEQGAGGHYVCNAPATLPAGTFDITAKKKINAWYAESDQVVANGQLEWNSTISVPLANLATSGQLATLAPIRIARGTSIAAFPVHLVSSADHISNYTSGATVMSGQISRDGGAFTSLQSGTFTEIGLGWYSVPLTSGDMLGNTIAMVFTANGPTIGSSDPCNISFTTQRTSGQ